MHVKFLKPKNRERKKKKRRGDYVHYATTSPRKTTAPRLVVVAECS